MTTTPVSFVSKQVAADRSLAFDEALASPCASCEETPCCAYLPVRTFEVNTLMDVDYVRYLLNFDGIVVGVSSSGDWSAYLHRSCRYLDPATRSCTVHDKADQPSVCRHYNPYSCWYRSVMVPLTSPEFLLVDRRRLDVVIEHLTFNTRRGIEATPDWSTLQARFAELPIERGESQAPAPDGALARWEAEVLTGVPSAPPAVHTGGDPRVATPCDGCAAACCDTVVFPLSVPATMATVDFLRFSLGFPGVEIGIGENTWTLAVKTQCRHLVGNRCGVYAQPERPLTCSYYDANHCTFKPNYTTPRPAAHLRVRLEQLAWLEELYEVDELGAVVRVPTLDQARAHIEARWRETGSPLGAVHITLRSLGTAPGPEEASA